MCPPLPIVNFWHVTCTAVFIFQTSYPRVPAVVSGSWWKSDIFSSPDSFSPRSSIWQEVENSEFYKGERIFGIDTTSRSDRFLYGMYYASSWIGKDIFLIIWLVCTRRDAVCRNFDRFYMVNTCRRIHWVHDTHVHLMSRAPVTCQ